MKAIIPAAGIGTRLRPHTHTSPKALLHVAGKPILGHILDSLIANNIRDIVFVVGFLGDRIIEYVKANYDIKAQFVEQKELKGLGWAIHLARSYIDDEPILIVLGDTILDMDLNNILKLENDAIGTKEVDDPRRFGIAITDGEFITSLEEKPDNPQSNLALVGVYFIRSTQLLNTCLEELIAKQIKTKDEYQLTDALSLMLKHGSRMTTFNVDGWYDCGKKETILETNRYLLKNIKTVNSCPSAVLVPPVFVSETATIKNSVIGPFVSIGDGASIDSCVIKNSIISSNAKVENCLLESSLIGNNTFVKSHYHEMNVGDSSNIRI